MAVDNGAEWLIGHRLLDRDGSSVGRIGQVFYDDQTDAPKWITVRTGLFGSREFLVPLMGARSVDEGLQVPFERDLIKAAPGFPIGEHISVDEEDRVYRHYGLRAEVPEQRRPEAEGRPRGRHARPEPVAEVANATGDADPHERPEEESRP
ncbi:PRC-barrel domain-containing protein [Nocardiopsis mangrovi]|uniref:PRC-barrel domain-containing protein n=1 Tax=Nocardiopsis mangrovi TaxID=1179818 RepID=A0ABV9E6J0_9ACTN